MVLLDGEGLTIDQVCSVAEGNEPVGLAAGVLDRMAKSRAVVDRLAAGELPIYGVNTGVGLLADVRIATADLEKLQGTWSGRIAAGVGEPCRAQEVRAMMLIRANVLAKGFSGIRPVVAERLCELLNRGSRSEGSVARQRGCERRSGTARAHRTGADRGRRSGIRGPHVRRRQGAARAGIEPLPLASKEGISLINGTQAMLALACLQSLRREILTDIGRCGLRDDRGCTARHAAGLRLPPA